MVAFKTESVAKRFLVRNKENEWRGRDWTVQAKSIRIVIDLTLIVETESNIKATDS